MYTQCPVASAPFPLAHMHVPITTSPSTHGGATSAVGVGAGAGASEAVAIGAAAAESDAAPETDADGTDGSLAGGPTAPGDGAQARGTPTLERARASSDATRRWDTICSIFAGEADEATSGREG
jgi:hypothetical protein